MILWFVDIENPLILVLLVCPILSIINGFICARFKINWYVCMIISFCLPLLFIANDINTFKVNIDAWLMYGIIYVLISLVVLKNYDRITRKGNS